MTSPTLPEDDVDGLEDPPPDDKLVGEIVVDEHVDTVD